MNEALKNRIFEQKNTDCFIERDTVLDSLAEKYRDRQDPTSAAHTLAELLDRLSAPVLPEDLFVGRMVEGPVPADGQFPCRLLVSNGHMSFDWGKILRIGLNEHLAAVIRTAKKAGDRKSEIYARNAETVIHAIGRFAAKWADAAEANRKERCAEALRQVPMKPARNLFEALQGIWLLHMIASCCVGSRDYAFGKMDDYLYPYYRSELDAGVPREDLIAMLSGFLIKANEICGRTAHDYAGKPILCNASKQYLMIGGKEPNDLSRAILDAVEGNDMPQPQVVVLLWQEADTDFNKRVFLSLSRLRDKLHLYNAPLIARYFRNCGIEPDIADRFTFSACCTVDLDYHTVRREYYIPTVRLLSEVMHKKEYTDPVELTNDFRDAIRDDLQSVCDRFVAGRSFEDNCRAYVLDGILIGECADCCRYPEDGGLRYNIVNCFLPGLATIGDSFAALDKYVFSGHRYTYSQFLAILDGDFTGHEELAAELSGATRFGNDTDTDRFTVSAANAMLDGVASVKVPAGWYPVGGFYSLERENSWSETLPATPDGRRAGTPFSENQSPVYGADRNGLTALLNSLSKIPFSKTATGGLNLTFSHAVTPGFLEALLLGYFSEGGIHAGICVLDRQVLRDAMRHPDRYPTLTVRLYGFSEYFIALSPRQQQAIINRTEY